MSFINTLRNHLFAPKTTVSFAWINQLSEMDDVSAIEFSTKKIIEHFKSNPFEDVATLQTMLQIDEKTHSIVERITSHFIHIDKISVELEERISNVVYLYHRELFLIYLGLAEGFAEKHPQSMPVFLARAFRNATQMIKWRYYNFQSAPANIWLQISQLYKTAEQRSMTNLKVQAYPELAPMSLSSAYIHASMLGTLESLSLACPQVEIASKILMAWTDKVTIDKVYDEEKHLFYVDTAHNKPAMRIRNFKPNDAYLYWNFDSVNAKIELCLSLIEYNISPKQPLMKEFISSKHALSTFQTLHAEWSNAGYKRQRRSSDRVKVEVEVTVAFGFKDICNQLKEFENIKLQRGELTYQGEKTLEERLAAHTMVRGRGGPNIIYMDLSTDHSYIIDESDKGLGLRVAKQAHEVNIGMLISISVKDQKYTSKIGVIRNIKPMANQELHIGVELLSNVGFCSDAENTSRTTAKLSAQASEAQANDTYFGNTQFFSNTVSFVDNSFGSDPKGFSCLYLPKEQSPSNQESLILPKVQYTKKDVFMVNLLGEDTLVRLTKSYEHEGIWVRATFTTEVNQ